MKATVSTEILHGWFRRNYDLFKTTLKEFEGKEVDISISLKKKSRSTQQNRYYWGGVIPIAKACLKEAGYNMPSNQVHDMLRVRFLSEPIEVEGNQIEKVKSTTELTTTEWEDYTTQVREWVQDFFGVYIPNPNEQITFE